MQENKSDHSRSRHPTRKRHAHRFATRTAARLSEVGEVGAERGKRAVASYPMLAVLTSFGLGIAVGVAIGSLLTEPTEPRWYERIPEALGRRWIEGLIQSLPESLREKVS